MSHGRDPGRGGKASQGVNQLTFATVWAGVLARDHFPSGTHAMRAKDRARHRKIVLIVDHYVPEPDRDAGSRTMIGFVRALLAAGLVVKFWPHNLIATPGYSQALRDLGVEVFHGPNHAPLAVWARENAADLDLVLLSRPDIATAWLPAIRACSTAKVVYYGHDLHFRRMRALGELTADETLLREAVAMRGQEAAIWRAADLSLYPSEDEAAAARALAPGADIRAVAAYGFETAPPSRDPPAAPEILFVAGFGHAPNQTAVSWFVADILPLIVAAIPGTRLAIVGADPSAEVLALRGPAIDLCANVTDAELNAWYHRARVAVVPLRAGAGVKRKTVEALWHGLPVVMTSVGAQGLDDVETVAAVADAPEAFAAAVCALLRDDALWRRRRASQIAYASERFSEAAFRRSLLGALGIGGSAAGAPDAERNPRLRPETRHADAVPQLALGEPLSGP